MLKVVIIVVAVLILLVVGCIILAAFCPPKEWKGDRFNDMLPDEQRKYQEDMYKLHQMGT